MKRFHWSAFSATVILTILVSPALAASSHHASAQNAVTASAVLVPAQVSQLGFVLSAPVKEVMVREGDQVQAGQTLVVLNTPELEYGVAVAQADLRFAVGNVEIQKYRRVKDTRNGRTFFDIVPPEVRRRVEAQAQGAQAALEVAQATLAQGTLLAPYDGTIVAVNILPGEFAQQSQVIVTLATLNNLQIETTDLSERDIPKIKPGDPASIFIEALHDDVTGNVIGISPIADRVGGDVVYKVTVAFDRQPENLLWGMTAEVMIGE